MLHITRDKVPDPDLAQLRAWLEHPGSVIFRKMLMNQASEKQAMAANKMMDLDHTDKPNDSVEIFEARTLTIEAKVMVAAAEMLRQALAKDYKFYTVTIRTEPEALTPTP